VIGLLGVGLLGVGLMPRALGQTAELVRVTPLALGADEQMAGALSADLDGDGRRDLLFGAHHAERGLELRLRRGLADGGLAPAPAWTQPLPPDVVAFAAADLTLRPGLEVLLLSGAGAVAFVPEVPEAERFVHLAAVDFLWQVPEVGRLLPWPAAVRDLDGDGDHDLLLPERGADSVQWTAQRLEVSSDPDGGALTLELEFSLSMRPAVTRRGPATLVDLSESVPAPWIGDLDGDGRLDVVAQDRSTQVAWLGGEGGFGAARRQTLPLEVDAARALDLSFASHLGDLDGDGDADSVLVARVRRDGKDRTQVLVHRQGFERPDQVLIVSGLVSESELVDADGDGQLDLQLIAIREDFAETLRSGGGERIEFDLYLYRNQGGTFSRTPNLRAPLSFLAGESEPYFELCADVNGDRSLELLARSDPERVHLWMLRARGETWQLLREKALWQRSLAASATFEALAGAPARSAYLVREDNQALLFEVGR
jgi:hypothetical protein